MTAVFYIKPYEYRGKQGFHVGSRGGDFIFPIAIFTTDRGIADTIRQAYRDCEAERITREERERITDEVLVR